MSKKVTELVKESPMNIAMLYETIAKMNTVDIADIFEDLNTENTLQIFRLLPKSMAADVFSYIIPEKQQIIVEALTDIEVGKIMGSLFIDDAVDFIEEMPANVVKRVLQSVDDDRRMIINQFLQYPEESAGSIMTTEYVDLKEDSTVREAFDYIRKTGVNKETIYTCYVIRRDRLLLGVVSAKDLMLANHQKRIGDIMDTNLVFAHTTDDQEIIADLFKKYGLLSLPVVDTEKRLVGIVTVDDVVNIIEEENTEDFEIMAALSPSDEPYLKTKVFKLAKNRIIWLMVLMLSATVTERIIATFEHYLAVLPILMAFIPMLMDTGGNAGSQSSALIIRGMALGEIETKDVLKVLWKELRISFICGLTLGVVNFIRIYFINDRNALLSLTVTTTLLITVMIAKCTGCLLPMAAKKLKIDPAVMAAPLITTIVDGTLLLVYFFIAKIIILR